VLAGAVVGDTFRVRVARQGIYLNKDVVLPKVAGPEWKDRVTVVVQTANRALIGKVLDPQGNPVAYASVSTSTQATTSTDANGDFVLRYLPEDKIWVQASKGRLRGYATTDATAKELTIKLSPARFVIM
jgi:hypothetical protein